MDASATPPEIVNDVLNSPIRFNFLDTYLVENYWARARDGAWGSTMFERAPENRMPVVVITNDGETIQGSVRLTLSNKLPDAMNGVEPFFVFVSAGGERFFIAKHNVRRIETFEAPRADQ